MDTNSRNAAENFARSIRLADVLKMGGNVEQELYGIARWTIDEPKLRKILTERGRIMGGSYEYGAARKVILERYDDYMADRDIR